MSTVLFRTMMIGENDPIGSEKVAAVREALSYCIYIGSNRHQTTCKSEATIYCTSICVLAL